jgi:multidrug resistance efflux pump
MKSNFNLRPEEAPEDQSFARDEAVSWPLAKVGDTNPAASRQGAPALQKMLADEFSPQQTDEDVPAKPISRLRPLSQTKSRILKSVAGLVILAMVGWMPLQRLFQVSSVEAVVNAQLVTLRAPINGTVSEGVSALRVGAPIATGDQLLRVDNPRVDHAAIDRVMQELDSAQEDLGATANRIAHMKRLRAALSSRIEDYRSDRIRRIDASLTSADAQIASAQAVMDRAEAEARRQAQLASSGVGTKTTLELSERDLAVARAALEQAKAQKAELAVEADALAAGRFFGDNYDDVPQSAQRIDGINETLVTLEADQARLEARVGRLRSQLDAEQGRFDLASRAAITTPAKGQVWEVLTAPGEQVVTGQPLVSLLDCSKLMVTAVVSESVYNTLSVGMPASFTFQIGGPAHAGHVVQLSGVAAAGSNFAILPSALTRESYRVTVAADDLAQGDACPVGRTGRVVFGAVS